MFLYLIAYFSCYFPVILSIFSLTPFFFTVVFTIFIFSLSFLLSLIFSPCPLFSLNNIFFSSHICLSSSFLSASLLYLSSLSLHSLSLSFYILSSSNLFHILSSLPSLTFSPSSHSLPSFLFHSSQSHYRSILSKVARE